MIVKGRFPTKSLSKLCGMTDLWLNKLKLEKKTVNFFVQTHMNLMSILYLALSYVVELLQFSFFF